MNNLNNKGQSLVLFITILPLILSIFAFVIDYGYILGERKELDNISKIVLEYTKNNLGNNDLSKNVVSLVLKNDTDVTTIDFDKNPVTIHLNKTVNSIFGKIIGIKTYQIDSKYEYSNNQIKRIK